jgi:hypothetical protein
MPWMLDYDGTGLLLRFSEDATDSFASSSFYKLFLKRYVYRIDTGCVVFKPVLTYLDYKKVIELCRDLVTDL